MTALFAHDQPAPSTRSRRERLRTPLLTVGGLAATTLALHLRDPHEQGSWGYCPLFLLTGIYCPGCGGLRAVNDLTDGDVRGAASSNLLATVAIPIVTLLLALWLVRAWRGTSARPVSPAMQSVLWWVGGVTAAVFTVLRNTPAGTWLAP